MALGGGHGEEREVWLNLVPMIDILTALMFFLLLGYGQAAEEMDTKGIELPMSAAETGMGKTVSVYASMKEIKIGDEHVMHLTDGKPAEKDLEGQKIIPLFQRMERIVQLDPKNKDTVVLLMADRRLKAEVVTDIMATVGMAGLPKFNFAVIKPQ